MKASARYLLLILMLVLPWMMGQPVAADVGPGSDDGVIVQQDADLVGIRYRQQTMCVLDSLPGHVDFGVTPPATEPQSPPCKDDLPRADRTGPGRLSLLMSFQT